MESLQTQILNKNRIYVLFFSFRYELCPVLFCLGPSENWTNRTMLNSAVLSCFNQGTEVLNTSSPAAAAPTVPAPDAASTTSGPSGPAGSRFKARTGSRSSPRTGLRPQNASRPGAGRTASLEEPFPAKQNQNKEQLEKKNQAMVQLRRLLVQGNQKVEALATVVQHLLTQVIHTGSVWFFKHYFENGLVQELDRSWKKIS